ncbi:ribonuclease HI [Mesorhizobium sp. M2D.F.Ca.ET.223.01.1.1]|nr:ribonuclease HI [Mesorhizobium sp. M2D.F.Ca.ET.223.01.1.1]TGT75401.1 ribonuclease HI [bacterium M00.F.Ca.ET.159.01.1.1]TGT88269.1 ribonuclease HI [bacterium M00.F.Ca.ET.157.01.1.1]
MRLPRKSKRPTKEQLRQEADRLLAAAGGVDGVKAKSNAFDKERKSTRVDRPHHGRAVPAGLVIYADGCCEPNPGIGGWGFVVYLDGKEIAESHGGDHEATNQRMELTAVLEALGWITDNQPEQMPRIVSDSAYTVNGCNEWRHKWKRNGWRRGQKDVANLDLWKCLDGALGLHPIEIEWCKGHAGIIGNERADELSLMGREMVLKPSLIEQQLSVRT